MARTSKYVEKDSAISAGIMWMAGDYTRLSKEDGDKEEGDKYESDSISNQKSIIEDYLVENIDINIADTYSDDGYTGTNFDRPNFIRLIEDIRLGKINCVIVKDLSRFGRNYIEAGQYLEIFFPVMKIRFISVLDNIDSYLFPESMNNISVSFKNVINEEYCRDVSNKVKSTFNLKRENGEYIGGFGPYGYIKCPTDKNKLIIDDAAADVVRMIFKWFVGGMVVGQIAIKLNDLGILNPSTHKRSLGMKFRNPSSNKINDGLWCCSTVRHILGNRMLIGDMVQGKREKISHKIAKIREVDETKWIIKEGTHEPIIDKTTFWNVQSMLKRDKRISTKKKELDLFSGFLKCADCGRAMNKKQVNKKQQAQYHYYTCRTYETMKKSACTRHTVRSDKLERTVSAVVSRFVDMAVEMDNFISQINLSPIKMAATVKVQNLLDGKEKERRKLENILLDLYPDWKNELISKEQYLSLKVKYETELERVKSVLVEIQKTYEREKEGITNTNDFLQNFIKHKNIDKLSREVLLGLVENIFVHEGGNIEIAFKFQDAFERAAEYIETNRELLVNTAAELINRMTRQVANGLKEAK